MQLIRITKIHRSIIYHSIPLGCIFALLALFGISINPGLQNTVEVYAAELTSTDSSAGTSSYGETGTTNSSSISLSNYNVSTTASHGITAIAGTTATINVTDAESYNLILSVEDENLVNGTTTIKPGNAIDDNTWGYYWSLERDVEMVPFSNNDLSPKELSDVTYVPPSSNGNSLGVFDLDENGSVSFTGELIFAAKFGNGAISGKYGTMGKLSLVTAPKFIPQITYDAVGGIDAPTSQECKITDAKPYCDIAMNKPTKSGYAFIGWDTNSNATNVAYRPKERIALTENQTLYAVWKQLGIWEVNGSTTNAGSNNMQDITSICSKVSTPATTATDFAVPKIYLQDTRDGSTYTVRKLADGKCWMTDNLHLRLTAGTPIVASVNATANGTVNWNPTESTIAEGTLTSEDFSNNDYYRAQSYVATPDPVYSGDIVTNYAGETGYYSWTAATAGSGDSSVKTKGAIATRSICPQGWKLPVGGTGGSTDFYKLFQNMGLGINLSTTTSTSWTNAQLSIAQNSVYNFAYTGGVYNIALVNTSTLGIWWSSTVASSNNAYDLYVNNNNVYAGTDNSLRYNGYAVRCVSQ